MYKRQALGNPQIKYKTVLQAVDSLEQLQLITTKVRIVWVKAHMGIEGNEEADKAAKEGASKANIDHYIQ